MPEAAGLGFGDFHETQGAGQEQHADDGEPDVELVADDLGRGAQPSEQGVFAVGRPPSQNDAVGADRREGQDVENADIDVADHKGLDREAEDLECLVRARTE